MLPTTPRCDSRSMKSSETRPSSRRATRVSWGVLHTRMSLVMEDPFHEPRPATRGAAGGPRSPHPAGAAAIASRRPFRGGERLVFFLDTEGNEGGGISV